MRALAIIAALMIAAAPLASVMPAYADGIEPTHHPRPHRPRRAHRPASVPAPVTPAPAPVIEQRGPEEVTLNSSFFSGGGVGVDIGTGYVGGGTTVIVGSGSSASAFAFASAHASAGARGGGWGGHHGGGGGCGCH